MTFTIRLQSEPNVSEIEGDTFVGQPSQSLPPFCLTCFRRDVTSWTREQGRLVKSVSSLLGAGLSCKGRQCASGALGYSMGDIMQPVLVEIISEGPHCVPCEYAIAAVEYVSESYRNLIEVRIVETKRSDGAVRYLRLCKNHGGILPMPSILVEGRLVFDEIPGPEELRRVLDATLAERERNK